MDIDLRPAPFLGLPLAFYVTVVVIAIMIVMQKNGAWRYSAAAINRQ